MIAWTNYYRPQKFSELELVSVREQMLRYQKGANFPQVLLFTGPKGTGKTSTARILAATLNTPANLPTIQKAYLQPDPGSSLAPLADPEIEHEDIRQIIQGNSYAVVEIDAASHRGIDDVRALQEQVYVPPSLSPVLVYILDEVHMFTNEAFNALLKILEEPPRHAFFILATTEAHKIPATVISRCVRVNYTKATNSEQIANFHRILADQKLTADDKVLEEIATLADGSFRDGVKYLQTVAQTGSITSENVQKLLMGDITAHIQKLTTLMIKKDEQGLINFFASLRQNNVDENFFRQSLFSFLHQQLIDNIKNNPVSLNFKQTHFLLKQLLAARANSPIPYLDLELTLLEICEQAKNKQK